MRNKLLLVILVALITDITLAQLAKVYWDLWDVSKIERNNRIHSNIYHHDLEPNVKTIGIHGKWRYRINTNSLGFKDKVVRNVPLNSNEYRILLIGDSFTEGNGVDFENTFVGIVSEELSGKGTEVLNAAVASYSPSIYYRKIKFFMEDEGLDFDEAIVFIDLSDAYDEINVYRFDEHENVVNASPSFPGYATLPANRKWHEVIGRFLKNNSVLASAESIIKAQYFDPDPPMGWGACYYWSGDEAILKDANRSIWTIDSDAYEQHRKKAWKNPDRAWINCSTFLGAKI